MIEMEMATIILFAGDYPDYNVTGTNDDSKLYGDQNPFLDF